MNDPEPNGCGVSESRSSRVTHLATLGGAGAHLPQQEAYREARTRMVEWLSQLSEPNCFNLGNRTVHLSVDILDCVGPSLSTREGLHLAALVCLLVAAKHEEPEEKVPTLQEMQLATDGCYSVHLIKRMELIVLQRIEWQLMRLTSVCFLENFAQRGACRIDREEDLLGGNPLRFNRQAEALETHLHRYASFFCDVCLRDVQLSQMEMPSVLAAAALACARRVLQLSPPWPERLRRITSYDSPALSACVTRMWNLFQQQIIANDTLLLYHQATLHHDKISF